MKSIFTFLFLLFITTFVDCVYADTDVTIEISINIEASVDEVNVSAELEAEICGIVKTLDPEPEEADDPTKLGNWESCETFDQCESGLCICYVCLDISEFIPYP